ncbi:malto-oligosyltrehalose trehalohydrolase [Polluticoccus soli]|uniref:malto-oligosyltrehalose trehalohydrolase n=1 Tax=Polluticoccus soli TaxID=3034150 RepID=UPI0023E30E62|nr:malto-oligosyltrehalose trehalohydrolase [Flavipsychrobacter sp. JY13-12]
MEQINVLQRGIGVNFTDTGEASINIWAPEKQNVEVLVNDTNRIALHKTEIGYWQLVTDKIRPGDEYKLVLDDQQVFPDPASASQPRGPHKGSEAIDIAGYEWTDNTWENIPVKEYIIYELHTGTFSSEGTFEGIEKKLDYLKELGITAIEIMPMAQFSGARNWGYDGVYPFAVQNSYGGANALKKLINECHRKGLAVILDVVYNHLGPEGNYLSVFGPYFTNKYSTPWGSAINFDDAWCDGVRRYFIENVLMWFRDFHIDALRMDAVHAIKDFSPSHILEDMRKYVDELMVKSGQRHYLIIESDLNDTRFIDTVKNRGYGMDAQWTDEFHHSLRVATGQVQHGYYADFEGLPHLAKAYQDAYVYNGIYSTHRKKTFGNKTSRYPGWQFIVFSQNHDQVGNRMLGERTSQLVSFEMCKLMVAAVMVSPYIPLLFMGEEYSESNPFLYFVSHTDADLVEAVREGRKAEFSEFHEKGEAPDPQSEDTFNRSKLQWDLIELEPHATMLKYYRTLIQLRKSDSVFSSLERGGLETHVDEQREILILKRTVNNARRVCLMNFSKQIQNVRIDEDSSFWKIFDSAAPEWNGNSTASETLDRNLTIQPESILIYAG